MKINPRIEIVITLIRNSQLLYIVHVMNESSIYLGLYLEELAVHNILLTMSNWTFIVEKASTPSVNEQVIELWNFEC